MKFECSQFFQFRLVDALLLLSFTLIGCGGPDETINGRVSYYNNIGDEVLAEGVSVKLFDEEGIIAIHQETSSLLAENLNKLKDEETSEEFNISYVLLAWLATAVVRIAQGSATVAMITGVGLMSAVIGDGSALDYHPVYIFLAIGFGSITLSWMNDSGFWVVQRLSGFTEKETLKTWSVLLTAISLLGLVITLSGSFLLPLR